MKIVIVSSLGTELDEGGRPVRVEGIKGKTYERPFERNRDPLEGRRPGLTPEMFFEKFPFKKATYELHMKQGCTRSEALRNVGFHAYNASLKQ